jgi:signal transduction histidine kinase
MENTPLTKFLPAERASAELLREQRAVLAAAPLLRGMLDAMPQFVMILNDRRQIVFVNRAVTRALAKPVEELIGRRPGEALGCIRAKTGAGCGTTEHCTVCGTGRALLSVLRGKDDERVCRMLVEPPGRDLDLSIRVTTLKHEGFVFTVLSAADRSDETRRRMLEKIFFHDALNTAGAVKGLSELIPEVKGDDFQVYCRLLQTSSDQLLDQILSQRDLASVENGEYALKPSRCPLTTFLEAMARLVSAHACAAGRRIHVEPHPPGLEIVTDRGLLMRVVGNMLKNAVEAEAEGAVVRLGCDARADGGAEIWVRNSAAMPRDVQLRLFQRAFSTKGADRGLGTYSMRLLSENYLGGVVTFRSEPARGTEFRVSLPPAVAARRARPQRPAETLPV